MTKLEKAVARYHRTLDRRQYILDKSADDYAKACDAAAAASNALGALDPELRTATYRAWQKKMEEWRGC